MLQEDQTKTQETPQKDSDLQEVFHAGTQEVLYFPKSMSDEEIAAILSDYTISTIPQEAPEATPQGRFDWWDLGIVTGKLQDLL